MGDSSGRSYVTEQWHNVPLLRTRALSTDRTFYANTVIVAVLSTHKTSKDFRIADLKKFPILDILLREYEMKENTSNLKKVFFFRNSVFVIDFCFCGHYYKTGAMIR